MLLGWNFILQSVTFLMIWCMLPNLLAKILTFVKGYIVITIFSLSREVVLPSSASCLLKHSFNFAVNYSQLVGSYRMVCYIKKYTDSLEQNVQFHNYNTRRKLDLHVQFCNTDLFEKSVVNMGIRLYNKVPDHIKDLENYKFFKKEFRSFLLQHAFYWVDKFISYWLHVYCICMWV
jgi:hypothetical protein